MKCITSVGGLQCLQLDGALCFRLRILKGWLIVALKSQLAKWSFGFEFKKMQDILLINIIQKDLFISMAQTTHERLKEGVLSCQ